MLLDTDHPDNSPEDRRITDRLYSGDRRHRIEQELVLGVGGARALAALGLSPRVFHLNEGHAGFLILELLDRHIADGEPLEEAVRQVRSQLVFTTHTPVPAGIDRFSRDISSEHLQPWADAWRLPIADVFELGRDPSEEPPEFNMAVFCLRTSARANGVSKLHGRVSRELFAHVPGGDAIGSITNGVHARTWTAPPLQDLLDRTCGPTWADGDADAWQRAGDLDDAAVRDVRRTGGSLLDARWCASAPGTTFDPDALTVGFARRFATYKRATLLLRHRDRLIELLADDARPMQFVFAGKAHPNDEPGKALLAEVVAFAASADALPAVRVRGRLRHRRRPGDVRRLRRVAQQPGPTPRGIRNERREVGAQRRAQLLDQRRVVGRDGRRPQRMDDPGERVRRARRSATAPSRPPHSTC